MNIVIPMVGLGKRFSEVGFLEPKPLIKVNDKEIIKWSIETLGIEGRYIFITRKFENENFNRQLNAVIKQIIPKSIILTVDQITNGAAESVLVAKQYINNNDSLIVTNCDQYLSWESDKQTFLEFIKNKEIDGCVTTFDHIPKEKIIIGTKTPYSFINVDKNGKAVELSEKIAISKHMLNGIHYWKNGSDFVSSAEEMISKNIRYNNEFYVSLTYNQLINKNKNITFFHMPKDSFMSLGTPEDIEHFKRKFK